MASVVMHLAIAKLVNEKLGMNERELFLGTIAPDLSKEVGKKKYKSHFYKNTRSNIPDLEKFIKKYRRSMKKPFEMGYYIHLYVDKLWQEVVASDLFNTDSITLLNGSVITVKESDAKKLLYSDFSNINVDLIGRYEIDLSLFYLEPVIPKTKIDEIPIKKLNLIIQKMGTIIKNSEKARTVVLDQKNVHKFIESSADEIIDNLKSLKIIQD